MKVEKNAKYQKQYKGDSKIFGRNQNYDISYNQCREDFVS